MDEGGDAKSGDAKSSDAKPEMEVDGALLLVTVDATENGLDVQVC